MIENNLQSNVGNTDDYGHAIVKDINFHERYFFERVWHTFKTEIYKSYFFRSESVICPFVGFKEEKKVLFLYKDKLNITEVNNFSDL